MTQRHPDFFKVSVREVRQDRKANIVLGKSLGVLPEAELLQPVGDLLHGGQRPEYWASSARAGNLI
jgi:hypothetical protein